MYCSNCGKDTGDHAVVCAHCGFQLNKPSDDKGIGALAIVCFLVPIVGLILFLVWNSSQAKKAKGAGISALVGFMLYIILPVTFAIAVPRHLRKVEMNRSNEAQTALSGIRKAYDVHIQAAGSAVDFSMEQALINANLGDSVLKSWKFEVVGNPPTKYIATSTPEFAGGEGKQLWYDEEESRFHGYGIDNWTNPDVGGSESDW